MKTQQIQYAVEHNHQRDNGRIHQEPFGSEVGFGVILFVFLTLSIIMGNV